MTGVVSLPASPHMKGNDMEWRDIESAPRDGTPVDLWVISPETGKGWRRTDCAFDGEYWTDRYYAIVNAAGIEPTHWLPLPPAPAKVMEGDDG